MKKPTKALIRRERELKLKESTLKRRKQELDARERKLKLKEKEVFKLEERLHREEERISSAEKTVLSRERKLYEREKALERNERKLFSAEKKKRSELSRILKAERRAFTAKEVKKLVSLREQERKKRKELAGLLSREYALRGREDALMRDGRQLEALDERIHRKDAEKLRRLEKVADAEKKLEEFELHLERDRHEIVENLGEIRRLRESLRLKKLGERVRTRGWKEKPPQLLAGNIYLVDEHDILVSGVIPTKSIELLRQKVSSRSKGLYVTRSNPKQVLGEAGLPGIEVIWMTDSDVTSGEYPTVYSLEHLSITLTQFIKKNPKSVILLDGLEYLVSNMGFDVVLPFIQSMRDFISTAEAFVIIPFNSDAFDQHQMSLLSRECYKLA